MSRGGYHNTVIEGEIGIAEVRGVSEFKLKASSAPVLAGPAPMAHPIHHLVALGTIGRRIVGHGKHSQEGTGQAVILTQFFPDRR